MSDNREEGCFIWIAVHFCISVLLVHKKDLEVLFPLTWVDGYKADKKQITKLCTCHVIFILKITAQRI